VLRAVWLGTCSVRFPVPGVPRQSASKDVVESGIVACGRFAVLGKTCRLCAVVMAFSFGIRRVWGGIIRMLRLQLSAKYFVNEHKSFYHTTDSMEDARDASSFSKSNAAVKSRKGTRPGSHMACKDVRCGKPVPERRTPTIGFAGITGAESGVEPVEKPRLSFHDRQQGPSTGPRVETSLAPSTGAARCAHPQMRHAVRVVGSFWLPYKNL
jgi:hypothetical protein